MAYYPGDIPAEDIVIEPARNGQPLDLTPFNEVDIDLLDPAGEIVLTAGFIGTIDDDLVVIEWPADSVLDQFGVYQLAVTLAHTVEPVRERLQPVYLVVQDLSSGWHTVDSARAEWPDAPENDDKQLHELLELARLAVVAYAPTLAAETLIPVHYRSAQLLQARNIWNSSKVQPDGGFGSDTFVIRPFPLDWQIKQILRPKVANPVVS